MSKYALSNPSFWICFVMYAPGLCIYSYESTNVSKYVVSYGSGALVR